MSAQSEPVTLSLSLSSVDGLIDAEGSPVIQPHIHPDAATWILEEAKENPTKSGYLLDIHVPSEDLPRKNEVESVIQNYFRSEALAANREFREVLRKGLASLVRAFLVVAALVVLAEFVQGLGTGRFYELLGESLVIIGWVTLWGPLDLLLFERHRIRRRRNTAQTLSVAKVSLRPHAPV